MQNKAERQIFKLLEVKKSKNKKSEANFIRKINPLLEDYNKNYPKTTKKELEKIIELCGNYIENIPFERREWWKKKMRRESYLIEMTKD
ncbi:MAG: hypothetical protein QM752_07555 [Gammaproteobacteria bacterium]